MKGWIAIFAAAAILCLPVQAADEPAAAMPDVSGATATAIFAGGCFWCVEADFEKLAGVIAAESGYTGGNTPVPNYREVSAGGTGHAEAVRVTYDPAQISYAQLLDYFWRHIDPTARNRQFCDIGDQYRSAIYYGNAEERAQASASKQKLVDEGRFMRIHTEIKPARRFYRAEERHQDYYKKNPLSYWYYRRGCGRDARVEELWGKPPH
jgi:peptide-methionine (S)-S-oxide reductase